MQSASRRRPPPFISEILGSARLELCRQKHREDVTIFSIRSSDGKCLLVTIRKVFAGDNQELVVPINLQFFQQESGRSRTWKNYRYDLENDLHTDNDSSIQPMDPCPHLRMTRYLISPAPLSQNIDFHSLSSFQPSKRCDRYHDKVHSWKVVEKREVKCFCS